MPVLVNKESGFAEDLGPEAARTAVTSGTHDLPLNDPQGNAVIASHEQAPGLLSQGYSQPKPEQLNQMLSATNKNAGIHHVMGAVEAVGRGLTGPAFDIAERLSGENPKAIKERAELDPGLNSALEMAGLVAGAVGGGGLATGLEHAGAALMPKGLGIISRTAAKAAIENALFQTGDEVSKLIQNDPNQSVGTAAANIGLSALLGGAAGGGFGAMSKGWNALVEGKAGSFVNDFKGRLQQHIDSPDPLGTLTRELKEYHGPLQNQAMNEVYGATGLRQEELQKILPKEMNEDLLKHNIEVVNKIGDALGEMQTNAHEYPAHNISELQRQYQNLVTKAQDPIVSTLEVHNALNEFKQYAQGTYKALQRTDKFELPYKFLSTVKDLGKEVRTSLESDLWGAAGKRNAAINKAWAEFQQPLKDFNSKFTTKIDNIKDIDPGKVQTYFNQLGNAKAEIKQEVMQNFLNAAKKFTDTMDKTHANLGITNQVGKGSTAAMQSSLQNITPGMKMADSIVKHGLGKLAGGASGAAVGSIVGHPALGAIIGQHSLSHTFDSIMPSLIKPLLQQTPSGAGFKAAMQYGLAVAKGEHILGKLSHAVFNGGRMEIPTVTAKERDKLSQRIEHLSQNPQSMLQDNQIGHYLPDHGVAISALSANAVSYLTSIKPKTAPQMPLDKERIPSKTEEANYNEALNIAQNPNIILHNIKEGSLTTKQLQHLNSLYPGYVSNMQSKLMESMIAAKASGVNIPYKQKLSMATFMSQPLDSSMTPTAITFNQMTIAPATTPQTSQGPKRPSQHGLDKLSKGVNDYMTPTQHRSQQRITRH